MIRRTACTAILVLAAVLAGSCGDDDGTVESQIIGDTLTVYASVPLRGALAPVARDVVRAHKLALTEAGGRAGPFDVSFAVLDSADAKTGRWDPGRVAANARRAVQDRQTIAYLGELETGASAVSVPILNEGGILQVSPRDTFGGLTAPGGRGEPDKYYPSGVRTFTRVVPGDDEQAELIVDALRAQAVRRLALADDRGLAGSSLADRVARRAGVAGMTVVRRARLAPGGEVPATLGAEVRRDRADGFVYTGAAADGFGAAVLREVGAAAPGLVLLGTDDLVLQPGVAAGTRALAGELELTGIDPRPRGRDAAFERRFEAAYGRAPDPQAVLGYDAMRVVLAAIDRAGPRASSRLAVIREAVGGAGQPRAGFVRYRLDGNRLVTIRRQM